MDLDSDMVESGIDMDLDMAMILSSKHRQENTQFLESTLEHSSWPLEGALENRPPCWRVLWNADHTADEFE